MNGEEEAEAQQEKSKETTTSADFVKQVNLRAWI
jgi:hypothetical protein